MLHPLQFNKKTLLRHLTICSMQQLILITMCYVRAHLSRSKCYEFHLEVVVDIFKVLNLKLISSVPHFSYMKYGLVADKNFPGKIIKSINTTGE